MNELLRSLNDFGLEVEAVHLDGDIKRCRCRGSKGKNGWYVGRIVNNHIYCTYGDWRTGVSEKFTDNGVSGSTVDVSAIWRQMAKDADVERERENAKTVAKLKGIITTVEPIHKSGVGVDHPYLVKKRIKPVGDIYLHNGRLIVPMVKQGGEFSGYQEVYPDGSKYHAAGTIKKGACFVIPGSEGTVCLCEGYATGASIHEATGFKVLVAMDAGNLITVAKQLFATNRDQSVLVCADNDHKKEKNTGVDAAKTIAAECGYPFVYPTGIDGTDFNDMHVEQGINAVQKAIIKGRVVKTYERKYNDIPFLDEILNPPGVLRDIADYYNHTATKPQPLLAIAAGIIVGSVVLGRRYTTGGFNNYTSLYIAVSAKSGTGKDHVKTTVRKILHASGLGWIERAGGYTAANTVVKSLKNQPLQLSFWEEFGLRLKEAGANNRSLYCGVFRQLLDIWSSCHSTTMGEEYADGTIPVVQRPALTMVGMSTVKQLFEAMTDSLIEQGFVNRILPFVSHAERSAAPITGRGNIEPPEAVIEWCQSMWPEGNLAEVGGPQACPSEEDEVVVGFSPEAVELLDQIEIEVVEQSGQLEKISLDDLLTRNRELTMRVSLIVAAMDRCSQIERRHVDWSWKLVSGLYTQYITTIKRTTSGSEFEQAKKQALEDLRKRGEEGIRASSMPKTSPWSRWEKRMRSDILSELQEAGLADVQEVKPQRGPARMVWVAIESDTEKL